MKHVTENNRVILVSFDGLRTDLIRNDITPNLIRLQRLGVTLDRHRTVYPSETRAAMPSLVTGAVPGRHGMVGNAYLDRTVTPPFYADTADDGLIEALDQASSNSIMGTASLGEILAGNGRAMAVYASNSPGTTRLFHHKARRMGHLSINGHHRPAATSEAYLSDLEKKFGPLPASPDPGIPDLASQSFLTSAALDQICSDAAPDLTVLSFGEPDISSHYCGTGEARTLQALRWCDEQFGRVLDWFETDGRKNGYQIIVVSDHGHVTVKARADVHGALRDAGFKTGVAPSAEVDAIVIPGQVGAVYLADPSERNVTAAASALMAAEWCGPIFTRGRDEVHGIAPGSFARSLAGMEHARAADVLFSFRSDDEFDDFGLMGRTWSDDWPIGFGVHGGLHIKEMTAACIMAGSKFKSDEVSMVPSGIVDITPTALSLLELKQQFTFDGRVLAEAFSSHQSAPDFEERLFEASTGNFSQTLRHIRCDETSYVDSAWR